jgi:hypothetical protein
VLLGQGGVAQLVGQEDVGGQDDRLDGLAEPPLQGLLAGQVRSQLERWISEARQSGVRLRTTQGA